jgi:hypothetical protein
MSRWVKIRDKEWINPGQIVRVLHEITVEPEGLGTLATMKVTHTLTIEMANGPSIKVAETVRKDEEAKSIKAAAMKIGILDLEAELS